MTKTIKETPNWNVKMHSETIPRVGRMSYCQSTLVGAPMQVVNASSGIHSPLAANR